MLHIYYLPQEDDLCERVAPFHLQHERSKEIYAIDIRADEGVAYVAVGGADKIAEILEVSAGSREIRSTAAFSLADQILSLSLVERTDNRNGEKGLLLATADGWRVSVFHVSFPATARMVYKADFPSLVISVAVHPFKNIVAVGGKNGNAVYVIGIDIRVEKTKHSYSVLTNQDWSQFRKDRQAELTRKHPLMKYSTKDRRIWDEVWTTHANALG
jgi:hypothetical protein